MGILLFLELKFQRIYFEELDRNWTLNLAKHCRIVDRKTSLTLTEVMRQKACVRKRGSSVQMLISLGKVTWAFCSGVTEKMVSSVATSKFIYGYYWYQKVRLG